MPAEFPCSVIISIHAPVKGATTGLTGDRVRIRISIHAPVKGATDWDGNLPLDGLHFNPRTREGCDIVEQIDEIIALIFQSTHP